MAGGAGKGRAKAEQVRWITDESPLWARLEHRARRREMIQQKDGTEKPGPLKLGKWRQVATVHEQPETMLWRVAYCDGQIINHWGGEYMTKHEAMKAAEAAVGKPEGA